MGSRGSGGPQATDLTRGSVSKQGSIVAQSWCGLGFDGMFGRAGISFLKLGTTMNTETYVAILEDHLFEYMAEAAPTSYNKKNCICMSGNK